MRKILKSLVLVCLCACMLFTDIQPAYAYTIKVDSTKYGYSTLSTQEKKMYKKILSAINEEKKSVTFEKYSDYKFVSNLYRIIQQDNPDIFWLKSAQVTATSRNNKPVSTTITMKYSMSKAEKDKKQAKIETRTKQLLKQMPKDADDYTKAKYIYETVIKSVSYDKENMNNAANQQMTSALLLGESVCAGYSKMYAYLLQKAGIQAMYMSGQAKGSGHAWVVLKISNQYYYSDVTWGDSFENFSDDYINYTYFLCQLDDFKIDHVFDKTYYVPVPLAASKKYAYFNHEDLYFTKFTKTERAFIDAKLQSGTEYFQIKCVNDTVLNAFRNYLYRKSEVVSLSMDDDRHILTVFLKNLDEGIDIE